MCTDVIILAGGSGERLWPASTTAKPKQFMALSDGETFLQGAIRRAAQLQVSGFILIITRQDWIDLVVADVAALARRVGYERLTEKVIVMAEPFGKNTAPAIAWASRFLVSLNRREKTSILMMASDHVIEPDEAFAADCRLAAAYAAENRLVTFAIPPTAPETGYGYILAGKPLSAPLPGSAFEIASFREKPDRATAEVWLADGRYYWNSGLYAFRADFMLAELDKYSPAISAAFPEDNTAGYTLLARNGVKVMENWPDLSASYTACPSISIDYAVSEKCQALVAVKASFSWNDVGSWDSLFPYLEAISPNAALISSNNCSVRSEIPVALCGVEDLVVVIENGRALIARRGETALVKDALAEFKKRELR